MPRFKKLAAIAVAVFAYVGVGVDVYGVLSRLD